MTQRIWRRRKRGGYESIDGPELSIDEYEAEVLRLIKDMARNTTMKYVYWYPCHCKHYRFFQAMHRLVEQGFLTASEGPYCHVAYRYTGKLWDSVR